MVIKIFQKIAVITGARAEYGYLRPLIQKLEEHPHFNRFLYVTGMHLSKEHGESLKEIKRDGFKIAKIIDMKVKSKNTPVDMALSTGIGIEEFAKTFEKNKPDLVIVFGDRIEPFAAATAASIMNIPVAHIGGGDVGLGEIDNNIRHAITKFSHLHFTSTELSKERVLKLGEEGWRVFKVGALSVDSILNEKLLSKSKMKERYGLPKDKPYILVGFHSTSTEYLGAGNQMRVVMEAVTKIAKEKGMNIALVYPNIYPGGDQIIKVIEEYREKQENIYVYKNLPHIDFLSLLKNSSVFVGNSSSGVVEAPSLGVPYVSVGIRQKCREKANNLIEAGYKVNEIISGINKSLDDTDFLKIVKKCKSPYGNGKASDRIIKILSKFKDDKNLLEKKMIY